jgi:hypothetical protein
MVWRRAARSLVVAILAAALGACGEPRDGVQQPQQPRAAPGSAASLPPKPPPQASVSPPPQASVLPPPMATPPEAAATEVPPPPPGSRDRALEVAVSASALALGWTGEKPEPLTSWPPPGGTGALDALVVAARTYAAREGRAARQAPDQRFDRLARIVLEAGVPATGRDFGRIVEALAAAGYTDVSVVVGTEPLELRLPMPPRPPEVAPGEGTALSYVRLRWARSEDGIWVDADAAYSEPQGDDDAPPGARPDLVVGLRSPWSCAIVPPEPTFTDALRRTASALRTFQLPHDATMYVELGPDSPFDEAWQLARDLRASGHEMVSLLRGAALGPVPESCPGDVGNAALLGERARVFLAQIRGEGVVRGPGLDAFGLKRAAP